ncbi:hypothetical protein D1816_19700 [Aquimarina sp. AD10]|uniref:Uncharacterized protein n=1 Tax=Aquimarina aggregata TaxID=1642818 RepID=A0A162CRB3_9FLAO|nr:MULTISPECIES: hypothetical protein [Aquimarina]AXT62490.1 hypothetical protein D1816_19700 [Aquimarina sp. AD10]KZS40994.1 hypothetical protein AWE51_23875 [Aquimarina aggregata]RKM90318.1 hypothetical protein D7033_22710 [Aquimarina sp. AD10]
MKNLRTIFLGILAASLLAACSDDDDSTIISPPVDTPSEASLLLESIRQDGGTPYDVDNPALTFTAAQNVFLPSVLGIDFRTDRSVVPAGPTARFPMFQGWETTPSGPRRSYYVITEASDRDMARELGVIFAPRMAASVGSGGVQNATWTDDGRLVFEGSVDFSPKRSLIAGPTSADGLLFGFPPAEVNPGAIADAAWSSYVVLPSGIVINAQVVANSTGIHDRIPHPDGNGPAQEDDLNNPNLATDQASVVMQLLDGWQDGKPYYFHIVTDTSDPGPATIELGVFAPRLAELPTFGLFPGGSMLPFSPTANGRTTNTDGDGVQGLNSASLSDRQVQDPTNTFPIDPRDERYAPMWDAHITEFTVAESERPILKSFEQVNDLLADGTLIPFRGNANPSPLANSLSDLLTATGAIINCPVITQPEGSVIGTQIGSPRNN